LHFDAPFLKNLYYILLSFKSSFREGPVTDKEIIELLEEEIEKMKEELRICYQKIAALQMENNEK
jgi:hypothetical protein